MKNKNLMHLKFEYQDALESKKDILNSEKSTMMMGKIMENYASLRKAEIKKKTELQKKIKSMLNLLKKIRRNLPEVESPVISKKQREVKTEFSPEKKKYSDSMESQLREIQRKLNEIGR